MIHEHESIVSKGSLTEKNNHDRCSKHFVCDSDDEKIVLQLKCRKVNKAEDTNKVHHLHLRTCVVVDHSMLNKIGERKTSSNRHNKVT